MKSHKMRAGLFTGAALFLALPALALTSASFKVSTFTQLDQGEPHGTTLSSRGEVVAGREAKRLKSVAAAMLWSTARGPGGEVYFGAGDTGQLLGVKGDKVRKVADLKTVLITALAVGPGGKVFAATMPGSRVLEVDPRTGKFVQRAKLPVGQIWDMVYDARTKRIFLATGNPGKIITIQTRDWTWGSYFDAKEKHLLCLEPEPGGDWLVGSSDKAILYRVINLNKAVALHDFDATELRDITRAQDGTIYIAVNTFKQKTSGLPRVDKADKGEGGTPISAADKKKAKGKKDKATATELRPGAKEGAGGLYRLDKEMRLTQLLALDKGYFTDIALDAQGVLWAGEGTKGKVYTVQPGDRAVSTALDLKERQVLALAVGGTGPQYIGTGDAGAIYRLSKGMAAQPQYWSEVLDAKFMAMWGTLSFQAVGKLGVVSRSGNTAKPDATWNNWSPAKVVGPSTTRLTSRPARYIQVGFRWAGKKDAKLRSFEAFYRPQNQRTRVKAITVTRVDAGDSAKPRSPRLKVSWEVENPDGDPLAYRVYLRTELGMNWRRINGITPLTKTEFEWDTEGVSDGYYRLKVVASDEHGNGPATTLKGELISERLLVDNRKPKFSGLTVRFPYVTGMAKDDLSTIHKVEYRLNSGAWRLLDPRDAIYDSPAEIFQVRLPARLKGSHVLVLRAWDEAGNATAHELNINIKR